MKQNRLGVATAVLLVLVAMTAWKLSARKTEDTPPPKAEVKVPKLKRDAIDELELTAAEHGKVRLVKKGDEWRVVEPLDAKADQDAVGTALGKLEDLEVTGVAATKTKNHEKLEVDAAKGTHVVAKGQGKTLLDAYVGVFQASNTMFRLEGQEQVATVNGSIRYAFNKQVREWRDREIAKVEPAAVQEVLFENKNGRFQFVREGEEWKQVLAKKEKAIDPLDVSKVKGLVGTAASLSAVDFAAPEVTPEQAGLGADAARVTLKLNAEGGGESQIIYRVGGQSENNHYLQRDGNPTIFLVSQWNGGRLVPSTDTFVKKAEAAAPADPHGMMQGMPGMPQGLPNMPHNGQFPLGHPQNPIQVEPIRRETVSKPAGEATKKAAAAKKKPAPAPAAPAAK